MTRAWASKVFSISLMILLVGCGSAPVQEPQDYGQQTTSTSEPTVPDKITRSTGNPALKELWDKAESARQVGDFDTAVTYLERALRLDAQDAVLWSRLAEIRLSQGNANQAENLAAKSNAMTADNAALNYRNWLIIAKARRIQGDDIGAQEAEYTANTFLQ